MPIRNLDLSQDVSVNICIKAALTLAIRIVCLGYGAQIRQEDHSAHILEEPMFGLFTIAHD